MVTLSATRVADSERQRVGPNGSGAARIADHCEHHAFIVIGTKRLYASHLTQHCMGEHAYQFIIEFELETADREKLDAFRQRHPKMRCFIANTRRDEAFGHNEDNPLTVPQLATSRGDGLRFDVYFGMPDPPGHDWPWGGRAPADLYYVPLKILRVVYFRPFVETISPPNTLLYFVFGAGDEAHMANLQFRYPDFDHVVTLERSPDWLPEERLMAGAVIELPDEPREMPKGLPLRCSPPFRDGARLRGRENGKGEPHFVHVKRTWWFSTKIPNLGPEPTLCPCGP